MDLEKKSIDEMQLAQVTNILCRATAEIMVQRYAAAIAFHATRVQVRMRHDAWATYHMPPQVRRRSVLDHHVIQFGTRCVESFFDKQKLIKNSQDDWEVRKYGSQPKYGPLTPAVALSFLVLHEFAHLLTYLDGHHKEGHGPRYKAKLDELHEANDAILVAAFLRSEAERLAIDLDAFFVPIEEQIPFAKGDRISWQDKAGKGFGTVIRVNKKSLTIQPDGVTWKAYIPPSLATKV